LAFRELTNENQMNLGSNRASVFSPRRLGLAILSGVIALALSACGSGDSSPPAAADRGGRGIVVIEDLAFEPETLEVEVGDTVSWTWKDGAVAHDVKGDDFQSEVLSEGTFRHRIEEPGTYDYLCTLHLNMTGTIEVTE